MVKDYLKCKALGGSIVTFSSVRNKRWPGGQWLLKTPSGHRVSKSGGQNGHRQFLAPNI